MLSRGADPQFMNSVLERRNHSWTWIFPPQLLFNLILFLRPFTLHIILVLLSVLALSLPPALLPLPKASSGNYAAYS